MKFRFLLAATLLLAACQHGADNRISGEPVGEGHQPAADTTASANGSGEEKLVKTAALQLRVANAHNGAHALVELAKGMGGSLRHLSEDVGAGAGRTLPHGGDSLELLQTLEPTASVTVRVPSDKVDRFLYEAGQAAAFVRSSDLTIEDKTLDYLEAKWRATAREDFLASGSASPKVKGTTAAIEVKDEAIEQRISQKGIDRDVRYSTVRVDLSQPPLLRREVVVNTNLETYGPPLGSRLTAALAAGWQIFATGIVALAHLWAILLVAALLWWGVERWRSRETHARSAK